MASADAKAYLEAQGLSEAMTAAVKTIIAERPANAVQRLGELLLASSKKAVVTPFNFTSGLPDCCMSNPNNYKVMAEIPGTCRLVEMSLAPGEEDDPHDHPPHSMYFVKGGKLSIKDIKDGVAAEPHVVEPPTGAPPIFPAGAHQVKNVGDDDVKVIFVEAYPTCAPCGDIAGFISPFEVSPECYKVLAENDDWITGCLTMDVGQEDAFHFHKDHVIYVLEGDGITIYPGGDKEQAIVKQIAPFHGLPAPMSAPPFLSHALKNSGTVPLKLIFFEMKK